MGRIAKTKLKWLNANNGTHIWTMRKARIIEKKFKKPWIYVELGSAYGGGLEAMAKRGWKCYGFDTFTGHPSHLSKNEHSFEATCMNAWYEDKDYGREALAYSYQKKAFKNMGLNVKLIKGEVTKNSCDFLDKVHIGLIDMDLIYSTRIGYETLNDKIVENGYLFMHDALPENHLQAIHEFTFNEILSNRKWKLDTKAPQSFLAILKRI